MAVHGCRDYRNADCRLSDNLHQTLSSHVTDICVNNAVSTWSDPVCTSFGPALSQMHRAPSCMLMWRLVNMESVTPPYS